MRDGASSVKPARVDLTLRRSCGLTEAFLSRLVVRAIGALYGSPAMATDISDPKDVGHILVARFDGIGDVVMTIPMLRALKTGFPNAQITFVTRRPFLNLIQTCPYIDHLVGIDPPPLRYFACLEFLWPAWALIRDLTAGKNIDIAINPRPQADDPFTAILLCLSGARRRIGYQESPGIYPGYKVLRGLNRLLTNAVPREAGRHEVEQTFNLLQQIMDPPFDPSLQLWLSEADRTYAEVIFDRHGVSDQDRLIAISPGCGDPRRVWPEDRYRDICQYLNANRHCRTLIVGGPEDRQVATRISDHLGDALVAVGDASLRQTAALLGRCDVFIGNDSGPMHIAAAMGIPVVEISCHPANGDPGHSNSPARFGPWNIPARILQPEIAAPPCLDYCASRDAHCIREISSEDVILAAHALLSLNETDDSSQPMRLSSRASTG